MVRKTLSRIKQAIIDPKVRAKAVTTDTDEYLKQLEKKRQTAPNTCMFC